MAHKEMKVMMKGAVILTITSFIAKILSAVYRVPFQNLVGDEGFYVYQQVYPIYGIAMTLALSGFPQFVSKIVAEETILESKKNPLRQLYPVVLLMSVLAWFCLFFGSTWIAYLMGDTQLASLIRVVSFTFLLIPLLSFFRGSFQGHLQMAPSGISQVIEQIVRVGIILIAAYCFKRFNLTVYQTGTSAMAGAVFGGAVAVGVLWHYTRKIQVGSLSYLNPRAFQLPKKTLLQRMLLEGGLVSVYSAYLIFFQLVDSFFVKTNLMSYGLSDLSAKIEKGVYDRGQPLVQLGLVVALALSSTFLPALTRYFSNNENTRFWQSAKTFLRITTAIGSAASIGLILVLPYMNFTLFKDYNGNLVLSIYVLSIGLMAVIQAYQSVLQSRNQFKSAIIAASSGLLVKVLLTGILTRLVGTVGASIATILGLIGTLIILAIFSEKEVNKFLLEKSFLRKLFQSLGIMIAVLLVARLIIWLGLGELQHRSYTLVASLFCVGIGGTAFLYTAVRVQLFTIREWLALPFGKKILRMKKEK